MHLHQSQPRRVITWLVATAVMLGAFVLHAPTTAADASPPPIAPAAASNDFDLPPWDIPDEPRYEMPDVNWDADAWARHLWYQRSLIFTQSIGDMLGARWKDFADNKNLRSIKGIQIRPDFSKYALVGGVMTMVEIMILTYQLIKNDPAPQKLLAESMAEIAERMAYLQYGTDLVDDALDQILSRTHMAEFRTRHELALALGTSMSGAYSDLLQGYADATEAGQPPSEAERLRWADDVIELVGNQYNYLTLTLPGPDGLLASYAELMSDNGSIGDDRVRYAQLYDYATTWGGHLLRIGDLVTEAYGLKMNAAWDDELEFTMLSNELEAFLLGLEALLAAIDDLGAPISQDGQLVTVGDWAVPYDYNDVPDGARGIDFPWEPITPDAFVALVEYSKEGRGYNMQERLRSLGIEVPNFIEIDEEGENRKYNFSWSDYADNSGDIVREMPCEYVGFTRSWTAPQYYYEYAHETTLFGTYLWADAWMDSKSSYSHSQIACVPDLHLTGQNGAKLRMKDKSNKIPEPPVAIDVVDLVNSGLPITSVGWVSLRSNTLLFSGVDFDLYHDGEVIEEIRDLAAFHPGVIDQLTFTSEPADVPTSGWAVLALKSHPDALIEFSGAYSGTETATISVPGMSRQHIRAAEAIPQATVELSLALADDGDPDQHGTVIVGWDGSIVGELTSTESTMQVPADLEEVTLTTDPAALFREGLVLVAVADAQPFQSWGADGDAETTTVTVAPGQPLSFDAVFSDSDATGVTIEIDRHGLVEVWDDGVLIDTMDGTDTVWTTQSKLRLLGPGHLVPAVGLALRPVEDAPHQVWHGWYGDASLANDAILDLSPAARYHLIMRLETEGPRLEFDLDGRGHLEVWRDGARVGTIDADTERWGLESEDSELRVTSDPATAAAVPLALLAVADDACFCGFDRWFGDHGGPDDGTLQLQPAQVLQIGASFIDEELVPYGVSFERSTLDRPHDGAGWESVSGPVDVLFDPSGGADTIEFTSDVTVKTGETEFCLGGCGFGVRFLDWYELEISEFRAQTGTAGDLDITSFDARFTRTSHYPDDDAFDDELEDYPVSLERAAIDADTGDITLDLHADHWHQPIDMTIVFETT